MERVGGGGNGMECGEGARNSVEHGPGGRIRVDLGGEGRNRVSYEGGRSKVECGGGGRKRVESGGRVGRRWSVVAEGGPGLDVVEEEETGWSGAEGNERVGLSGGVLALMLYEVLSRTLGIM